MAFFGIYFLGKHRGNLLESLVTVSRVAVLLRGAALKTALAITKL